MVATSVLKSLAKIISSMLVANRVTGSDTVPAFALPKAENAIAGFCASAILAGNSATLALNTLKFWGGCALTRARMAVNVKKFPSTGDVTLTFSWDNEIGGDVRVCG
ncbi:hypothetical protein Q3G72_004171 [Acer saccharum]|nr:hypothetical protein Q3G72_004171 [Acer saccharum]